MLYMQRSLYNLTMVAVFIVRPAILERRTLPEAVTHRQQFLQRSTIISVKTAIGPVMPEPEQNLFCQRMRRKLLADIRQMQEPRSGRLLTDGMDLISTLPQVHNRRFRPR
jgi:hypothetical protein